MNSSYRIEGPSSWALLINGNCLDVLPTLEVGSVDCVVTDPPYGLNFMGKDWDHGIPGKHFWQEVARVCLPGSPMLSFGGTRTFHRLVCAIEDAGWEVRDTLMWLHGQGFPKSLDISKAIDKAAGAEREVVGISARHSSKAGSRDFADGQSGFKSTEEGGNLVTAPATDAAKLWDGWGTALKPAFEPICLAMKPLDGTFAENALKHGVAGLAIDRCRIPLDEAAAAMAGKAKQRTNKKSNFGVGDYGSERQDIEPIDTFKANGRWPANILHDGSEEVLAGFPQVGGGQASGYDWRESNNDNPAHITRNIKSGVHYGDSGSAARFFYCAKASRSERGADNKHPTVKPLALMEYLVKLATMPQPRACLDPFMGSGTTGVACMRLGRNFIGIEKDSDSFKTACDRIAHEVNGVLI